MGTIWRHQIAQSSPNRHADRPTRRTTARKASAAIRSARKPAQPWIRCSSCAGSAASVAASDTGAASSLETYEWTKHLDPSLYLEHAAGDSLVPRLRPQAIPFEIVCHVVSVNLCGFSPRFERNSATHRRVWRNCYKNRFDCKSHCEQFVNNSHTDDLLSNRLDLGRALGNAREQSDGVAELSSRG